MERLRLAATRRLTIRSVAGPQGPGAPGWLVRIIVGLAGVRMITLTKHVEPGRRMGHPRERQRSRQSCPSAWLAPPYVRSYPYPQESFGDGRRRFGGIPALDGAAEFVSPV